MKFYAISENHLYRKAYKSGARKSSRTVTVFVMRDKEAAVLEKQNPKKELINRVGIPVSKKVGDAVHRNRAKRVIREAYRQIDKLCGVKRGFLVVICPRIECTVRKEGDVYKDLLYCLSSLDMLCGKKDGERNDDVQPPQNMPANDPETSGDEQI